MPQKKKRIWELDTLRGIAVLAMVFDHLTFDLADMSWYFSSRPTGFMASLERFGVWFQNSGLRFWGHYVFVTLFLLLVGVSCTFSKSNGMRAFLVFLCGAGVSVATRFMALMGMLDQSIVWGILQNIGFGILLYMFVRALWNNKYFMLGCGAAFILAGILINWTDVPQAVIPRMDGRWDEIVWFIKNEAANVFWGLKWYGPDCFGVLPCAGVVLVGGYLGQVLYARKRSLLPALDGGWNRPFRWVGRHALVFYIAHQPATLALVILLGMLFGMTPAL